MAYYLWSFSSFSLNIFNLDFLLFLDKTLQTAAKLKPISLIYFKSYKSNKDQTHKTERVNSNITNWIIMCCIKAHFMECFKTKYLIKNIITHSLLITSTI